MRVELLICKIKGKNNEPLAILRILQEARLIRQYFVKGSSFVDISCEEVEAAMDKLNHQPRKTLNYDTPHAVFFNNTEREASWLLELHFRVESTK